MIKNLTLFDIFHNEIINPISINFNNVLYYCRNYADSCTDIVFIDGTKVQVKEDKEVIDSLFGI